MEGLYLMRNPVPSVGGKMLSDHEYMLLEYQEVELC